MNKGNKENKKNSTYNRQENKYNVQTRKEGEEVREEIKENKIITRECFQVGRNWSQKTKDNKPRTVISGKLSFASF